LTSSGNAGYKCRQRLTSCALDAEGGECTDLKVYAIGG
jgi:hypothetical protein